MKTTSATTELQRMTPKELQKEISLKRAECSKFRIAIEIGAEKNHARYRHMHREIACMVMVYDSMRNGATPMTSDTTVKATKTPKAPVSSRSPKKKK